MAPRRESTTSVRLLPTRSAWVVTPTVAKADPASPAATDQANVERREADTEKVDAEDNAGQAEG